MRFSLLGPLAVHDGKTARTIDSPKARALLGVLLLHPNQRVLTDRLQEALWGAHPPTTAGASLKNHMARLRRALAEDGSDEPRILAAPGGYALRVGEGELDAEDFTAALRDARAAYLRQDWETVSQETESALGMWRGNPLPELADLADAQPRIEQYTEARWQGLEWRIGAELALGRHHGLAPELTALIAEQPLRETFHRQLMLVLHRTDQQAEALAVFRRLRRALVDELGVEPGAGVMEAHQEILKPHTARTASANSPGTSAEEVPPTPTARWTPAQLPLASRNFVGRSEHFATLTKTLTASAATTSVAVVSGMAGVGKSSLAVQVATSLCDSFPGGQLFLNLHGATAGVSPLAPIEALTALLTALGVEAGLVPVDIDAASALLRSMLVSTRTLIVLDDAASAAQVRPLLPADPSCAVLVTSRSPLTTLDTDARITLEPLSQGESFELVELASGRERLHADLAGAERLVELCGRLPLALRVVAARLAARRALTVQSLVQSLVAEDGRLDHLDYDDLSVRRSLAVAYEALCQSQQRRDGDAALALRRLGALDLDRYDARAVARLMNVDQSRATAALERLVDVALVEEPRLGRYELHDLVRDFAHEAAEHGDTVGERADAVDRALRWYAATVGQMDLLLDPSAATAGRRARGIALDDGSAFPAAECAMAWCDSELANIVALVNRYVQIPAARPQILHLVRVLFSYLMRRGCIPELQALNERALIAAQQDGDVFAEAHALGDLAAANFRSGNLQAALSCLDDALAIWRQLEDPAGEEAMLGNKGMILIFLGRHDDAVVTLKRTLVLARRRGAAFEEALALNRLGTLYERVDARVAIDYQLRSLEVASVHGLRGVQCSAHEGIGCAYLVLGEPEEALPSFETALGLLDDDTDWNIIQTARLGFIRALRDLARHDQAADECLYLLDLAQARDDTYVQGLVRHQYGCVMRALGNPREARQQWQLARQCLDGTDAADVLSDLVVLLNGTETGGEVRFRGDVTVACGAQGDDGEVQGADAPQASREARRVQMGQRQGSDGEQDHQQRQGDSQGSGGT
ncbi:BTAD domain-containing putative transcriptional regulator [Streptacidiphilus sp. EB129]|uniref:AfsR/SARP family transcriptional regulator n=1 Tax=Streptacidiphilus sp. EB129 TaxID=3156262 RepID=UPI0035177784